MLKILRYIFSAIKEFFFIFGIWSPKIDPNLLKSISDFTNVNNAFWKKNIIFNQKKNNSKKTMNILIEGHLSNYGPNYLYRTALAAKAIEDSVKNVSIQIITNGFSHQWKAAQIGYASFNITSWIFLAKRYFFIQPFIMIFATFRACIEFFKLKDTKSILSLCIGKIKLGDLIYDQVLRSTKKGTIRSLNINVFLVMIRSYYYYYQYFLFFWNKKFSYYIATHTAYPEYGILARIALKNKIKVIETSDIQMSLYDENTENFLPTYHDGIHAKIISEKAITNKTNPEMERSAKAKLEKRFNNKLDQVDARESFAGKVYSREGLLKQINLKSNKNIGFIFAHIFVDSPHLSKSMLYLDYYQWLKETIKICSQSSEMIWIVKPHPAVESYSEDGEVEKLLERYSQDNVFICPKDFNTKSIIDCADVITTVHGTVGLEFSSMGIPVVLAGTPFYSNFGFTLDPNSIEEYRRVLINAHTINKLTDSQISSARCVFDLWEEIFDWNNPIYTSEVLVNVWGRSGVNRDLNKAYKILTDNLKQTDPREIKLWHFVKSISDTEYQK